MRKLLCALAALTILAGLPALYAAGQATQEQTPPQTKTLTGEPIDVQCYMTRPTGFGAGHAACAARCLERGLPAGLLVAEKDEEGADKKQVYLLIAAGERTLKDLIGENFGKQVNATGRLTDKDGIKVLQVETIATAN
jgi:hypothetical protein